MMFTITRGLAHITSPRDFFLIEEALFFQCFEQAGGHGLIVFLRIADVSEDLGEGLLVVDLAEMVNTAGLSRCVLR